MKLVFALYKYFPFGGLQKDMLAIAQECVDRGHEVQIFCQSWSGDYPADGRFEVNVLVDKKRWWINNSNHVKNQRFAKQLHTACERLKPDLIIGFNKIPGVDVYYAADTCFKAKLYEERSWLNRLLPRYRSFLHAESAVFDKNKKVHVLAIAQKAIDEYQRYYQTPSNQFTLLPPGISRDRINTSGKRTHKLHQELGLPKEHKIILMVGSGFRTKGVDRAIAALAAWSNNQPGTKEQQASLVIVGEDKKESFVQLAQQLDVEERIVFLGGRKDIPDLLKSADLLIHPARRENTGTVLLEAAVACLPVLVTAVCGYSAYIAEHDLGWVIVEPFNQTSLNEALEKMLASEEQRQAWRNNGQFFANTADIYSLPVRAAEIIEQAGKEKGHA